MHALFVDGGDRATELQDGWPDGLGAEGTGLEAACCGCCCCLPLPTGGGDDDSMAGHSVRSSKLPKTGVGAADGRLDDDGRASWAHQDGRTGEAE